MQVDSQRHIYFYSQIGGFFFCLVCWYFEKKKEMDNALTRVLLTADLSGIRRHFECQTLGKECFETHEQG